MNTKSELVKTWCESVSVMHIAHHIAASRYSKWHRSLGVIATMLAAIVGTSIFVTLSRSASHHSSAVFLVTGLLSMASAALTAAVTFLNLDQRSGRHLQAAADFQRLRREMEEEVVRLSEGKPSDSYDSFKNDWHAVLKASPPLPQRIHDCVKKNFEKEYGE